MLFPGGYRVDDIYDDNLDVNIILENGDVYVGSVFTLQNIKTLMSRNGSRYFWSSDMIILEELSLKSINAAIEAVLKDDYFTQAFTKIGLIATVYSDFGWNHYSDVLKDIRD